MDSRQIRIVQIILGITAVTVIGAVLISRSGRETQVVAPVERETKIVVEVRDERDPADNADQAPTRELPEVDVRPTRIPSETSEESQMANTGEQGVEIRVPQPTYEVPQEGDDTYYAPLPAAIEYGEEKAEEVARIAREKQERAEARGEGGRPIDKRPPMAEAPLMENFSGRSGVGPGGDPDAGPTPIPPTRTPVPTATSTPGAVYTAVPTATPDPNASPTASPEPTPEPSPTATPAPTGTGPTPTATATPDRTVTPTPSYSPTPSPSASPSPSPTETPEPTETPSPTETVAPSGTPTESPTPIVGSASIRLEPGSVQAGVGEIVTLDLVVRTQDKAAGGYTTLILYNPLQLEVYQVREGQNPWLGYPFVLDVDNPPGSIIMSSFQGSVFDQPIGYIHVGYIDFIPLEPGTAGVDLAESEVVNTDAQRMNLVMQRGTRIEVAPAPEGTE